MKKKAGPPWLTLDPSLLFMAGLHLTSHSNCLYMHVAMVDFYGIPTI
jgi:hypothetical protein